MIDSSGEWWVGTAPEDIEEYLGAYSADTYPVHEFRLSTCPCGSKVFELHASRTEGIARRTCVACKAKVFIADSEEHWKGPRKRAFLCPECGSRTANIGVGFSLYPEEREIKWLYVGCRCSACGLLGCFAEWKIGYAPSRFLLNNV